MVKEEFFGLGVAFACDFEGRVTEVVWDDFRLADRLQGSSHFVCIFDENSVKKGLAFFLEVKEYGAAFDWEIDVCLNQHPSAFCFSALVLGDRVVVLASVSGQGDNRIYDGLSQVINRQGVDIRALNKRGPAVLTNTPEKPPGGDRLKVDMMTDMMALNNRLVNAERELARKHAELRRMSTILSKDLHLAQRVLHFSGEAVMIADRHRNVVDVNSAYTVITGFSKADVLDKNLVLNEPDGEMPQVNESILRAVADRGIWQGECQGMRKDGSLFPKWLSISVIPDDTGEVGHYVVNFSDISRLKFAEEQWRRLAYYDTLTNLPNRTLFKDRLQQAIIKASRSGESLVLLYLDLDEFKFVNDSLGHDVGDLLLCETARRLEACVRKTDTIYRLGGDEFTVIIHGCQDDINAQELCEKIINTLKKPFQIGDKSVYVGVSIGIARHPLDGDNADILTKNADTAMYAAKASGRNRSCFYSKSLGEKVAKLLNLRAEIEQGLMRKEFVVYLQPEIDLATGSVVALEALVRWRHPTRGLIGPNDFIPVAEDSGLIIELGEFVICEALQMVRELRDHGWQDIRVAVNVSCRQLLAPGFTQMLVRRLEEQGLPGRALVVEITESMILQNLEHAVQVLHTLKEHGIDVAMDDFGTGYSSLNYLRRLPVALLKIDKSFVADIDLDQDSETISRAILAMAKSLGIKTIAEGIERTSHQDKLADLGCDVGQGYLYSKPLPFEQLVEYMENGSLNGGNGRLP